MKSLRREDVPASPGHYIVGKVQKAHGIRGEIFVYLFAKEAAWIDQLKEILLIIPPAEKSSKSGFSYKNFPLEAKRFHKDGLILSSAEIKDRNQAEELKGAFLQIPESFLQTDSDTDFYLKEILAFDLRLDSGEVVGQVIGFADNGMQDLAVVKTAGGEYSVPLVDEWIVELNRREKYIRMALPPGLLDNAEEE